MNENTAEFNTLIKQKKRAAGIWGLTFSAVALTVAAALLRILALFFDYNPEMQYFNGRALSFSFWIVYGISVLGFAVTPFFLFGKLKGKTAYTVAPPSFLFPAIALVPDIGLGVYTVAYILKLFQTEERGGMSELENSLLLPSILLSVASMAFFIMLSIKKKGEKLKTATAFAGVAFVLWCVVGWLRSYLDFYVPMNSPNKIVFHFAIAALLLFTVCELRALCSHSKPRLYCFSLFFAMLATAVSSIPSLVGGFIGIFNGRYTVMYEDLVFLGMFIYILTRAVSLLPPLSGKPKASELAIAEEEPASNECADISIPDSTAEKSEDTAQGEKE